MHARAAAVDDSLSPVTHAAEKEVVAVSHRSQTTDSGTTATTTTTPNTYPTPPDGGYGWVVVGCQTTINAMTWGVNASYAVYLSCFTAPGTDYFPGTTTLQYSFVGGVSVGMALCVSPLANVLTGAFGYRVPMMLGCVLEAASFVCASFATEFWHLFLSQGVLFGVGMGLLFAPSVGIPSRWFSRRRALATGICAGGSGLGGVVFNLGTDGMIRHVSLAWAYRITAIVVFVSNLTATLLTRECVPRGPTTTTTTIISTTMTGGEKDSGSDGRRRRHVALRKSLFDATIFRHAGFVYILAWGVASLLGYVTLQFSISKYAVSALGLSQTQGSRLAALLSAGMAVGRPGVGFVADRFGRINAACVFTAVSGVLVLTLWLPARGYAPLVVFAVVEGCVAGTFWSLVVPVTAEVVGMPDLEAATSMVWLTMSVPCTLATTIALAIVGGSGEYDRLVGFAGGCYILAAGLLVGAKVEKQRRDGVHAWAIFQRT